MYITLAPLKTDGSYTFKVDCLDKPRFYYHNNCELSANISYTFKVNLVQ